MGSRLTPPHRGGAVKENEQKRGGEGPKGEGTQKKGVYIKIQES